MSGERSDHDIKAAQAQNFDGLNAIVAGSAFDRHLRFLNFGYRVLEGEEPKGPRLGFAFPNKDSAQLLFQTIGDTPLEGRTLVEIGCGRGGNLWLARRKCGVGAIVGVDIAAGSVAYCQATNPGPGAGFIVGDAERVPLGDECADAVLSIETGATYPDIERFHREAARVLRVGGHLLYADIIATDLVDVFVAELEQLGLEVAEQRDITANVVAARDERAERQHLAFADADAPDQPAMAEFAGVHGSALYAEFESGAHRYALLRMRKTRHVEAPTERILTADQRATAHRSSLIAVEALTLGSTQATGPG